MSWCMMIARSMTSSIWSKVTPSLNSGNRKYIKCLYCYNKIDTISMEEVNMIAEQPNTVVISCNMKLNFDGLL